jgi:hypothetical protein
MPMVEDGILAKAYRLRNKGIIVKNMDTIEMFHQKLKPLGICAPSKIKNGIKSKVEIPN